VLSIDLLRSIGTTYTSMHDYASASAAFSEALDHSLELQGPNHPQTLVLRRALAQGYVEQGHYEDAAREYQLVQNALNDRPQGIGSAIRSQLDLAATAQQMGQLVAAQTGYQRAVRLANGRDDYAAAEIEALTGLSAVYRESGNYPAALRNANVARRLAKNNPGIPVDIENRATEAVAETQNADGDLENALETLDPVLRRKGARASKAQALNLHARAQLAKDAASLEKTHELIRIASRLATSAVPADPNLVWRLQSYDADAVCRTSLLEGKKAFDLLINEIKMARPDGATRLRETEALATQCGHRLLPPAPATPRVAPAP
jgi:serine/threonine-protein kinase